MNFSRKYDVAVVGGGIAGVAAALAAARRGAKTILIEKTIFFGGLATTGMVYIYLPLCDGNGHQVSFGITEELLRASMKYGPGEIPPGWSSGRDIPEKQRFRVAFSPASFIIAMDELLSEAGVDLWLDTLTIGAEVSKDRLHSVTVANKSGLGRISAGCFVDASGDADLAFFAGAPVHTDSNTLSFWCAEHFDGQSEMGPGWRIKRLGKSLTVRDVPEGVSGRIVSEAVLEGRRRYREFLSGEYAAGAATRNNRFPVTLPGMAQLRHTRCIKSSFMLDSGMEWRSFDDSIGLVADWRCPGKVWEIPYRTLLPLQVGGMLAVGRCCASRGDAWEVTRVIPAAALTGEVAGVAAAMAVEQDTTPDNLSYGELCRELRKNGFVFHFSELGISGNDVYGGNA